MLNQTCKIDRTLKFLGNKWTFLILYTLMDGEKRFKELHYLLDGISPKTLTERLRSLEKRELVARKIYPVIPPKVEYSITSKGKELRGVFDALDIWSQKYLD